MCIRDSRDPPLNVLLFVPLGFGLAGLLAIGGKKLTRRRKESQGAKEEKEIPSLPLRLRPLAPLREPLSQSAESVQSADDFSSNCEICVICGSLLLLSVILEAAQLFLPQRAPSVADVVANGLGALLGVGLYRAWAMGVGRALRRYVTRRNLLVGLGVYVLLATWLTVYLYRSVRLSNWDTSFPLVVGNEAVGRRQWSGKVHRLSFDAYCDSDIVSAARYDFDGPAPYANLDEDFTHPALDWSEGSTTAQDGQGVRLGPGEWLTTTEPFRDFSEQARRCHSFALTTLVATIDPAQRGPARIISISADAERRNITLGQEADALIIRLRTPAGGENGQKPEVLVPGVFTHGSVQWITVRYIALTSMLYVWVDGGDYALSLAPGAAFFPGFATENRWPVVMGSDANYYNRRYWALVLGMALLLFGGPWVARRWVGDEEERSAE